MTSQAPPPAATLDELFGLHGRVAVVIGGTSGRGAASAVALATAGATVVVAGRDARRAAGVAAVIADNGGTATTAHVDVTEEAQIEALAATCIAQHGHVDILVNAAGIFEMASGEDCATDAWRRIMDVNVTGTFLACRAFGRHMLERGSGSIVNFASTDSLVGVPLQAAYCASKGAVHQLTRTLGAEWIKQGVRVNAVGPCDFDTPMIAPAMAGEEYRTWILDAIPAGRVGQAHEIGGAVVFLASDAASMVVGHTLMVDGGRTVI